MLLQGNAMLAEEPEDKAPISQVRARALTPLFGLPLPADAPACGDCSRFRPVSPFEPATGRCALGVRPGFINRATTGCGLHRFKGAPTLAQTRALTGRAVRP